MEIEFIGVGHLRMNFISFIVGPQACSGDFISMSIYQELEFNNDFSALVLTLGEQYSINKGEINVGFVSNNALPLKHFFNTSWNSSIKPNLFIKV